MKVGGYPGKDPPRFLHFFGPKGEYRQISIGVLIKCSAANFL